MLVRAILALVLASTLAACSDDEAAPPRPAPKPTPITRYDGTVVGLVRAPFCDAVPRSALEAAVGAVTRTRSYGDGQRARVTGAVKDVAHEYSCTWVGETATARAWLFAPPVTRKEARALLAAAKAGEGCRAVTGHRFGKPTTGLLCRRGKTQVASYRGLFGDAWLTCTLTLPATVADKQALARTGRFCVQVAEATRR